MTCVRVYILTTSVRTTTGKNTRIRERDPTLNTYGDDHFWACFFCCNVLTLCNEISSILSSRNISYPQIGGLAMISRPVLRIQIRIRIRIHRIHMFLGLLDPDPDPLVRCLNQDPDPALDPDPSIIMQK